MKQPSNIIQFGTNEDVVFATKQSTFSEFQMRQDLDIFEQLHWLLPTTIVNKIKSQSEYIEPHDVPTTKPIAGWNMHIIVQEKAIMQARQNPQSSTATNNIAVMSLLIRYAHIPFYFRFPFTFPTSPIHHYAYAPLLRCDCTCLHDNHTHSIGPISLI